MKKGAIFTIDALLALSIFIAVLIGIYSHFGSTGTFGIVATNVYANVDSYIHSIEESEIFSNIIKLYQQNETETATNLLTSIAEASEYDINIYLLLFECEDIRNPDIKMLDYENENILKVAEFDFDEKFVLSRYLVYTTTNDSIQKQGTGVNAPSSLANRTIEVEVSEVDFISIYDENNNLMNWDINNFEITIPADAIIGTYYVQGNENSIDPFNVFRFGMVVVEIDTE